MKNLGFKEHRVLNLKKTKLDSIKIELNSAFIECIKILMHTYHGVDLSHLRLDYMKLEDLFVQVKYSEEVGEFICGELCHLQTKEKNEERKNFEKKNNHIGKKSVDKIIPVQVYKILEHKKQDLE